MRYLSLLFASLLLAAPVQAQQVDDKSAQKLLKQSKCTNCHSVTKEKDGPPYKKVAEDWKGKPDAEAKLYEHVTTSPMVKVKDKDGNEKEEAHEKVQSDDPEQVKNLVRWILSR